MKFRYKIVVGNLILISIGLGLIGYLMIRKNFNLARESIFQTAVTENNLVKSSIEYEVMQKIFAGGENSVLISLPSFGSKFANSIMMEDSDFYIIYGKSTVFSTDDNMSYNNEALLENATKGDVKYMWTEEGGKHYIEVVSFDGIKEMPLYFVTRKDVSSIYEMLDTQIKYFRIAMAALTIILSILSYSLSYLLIRPLEKLRKLTTHISEGNYHERVVIKSHDEIGNLAQNFNMMSGAVEKRVEELDEMVHKREQFIMDFTHEIKTPMTSIIGYADTMRSVELDRENRLIALNYIFSEGKRLENMSHKLLDLLYLRQKEVSGEVSDAEAVGREAVESLRPSMDKKSINLVSDFDKEIIPGEKELLVTVFINLLDNARKASEENSTIIFSGKIIDGKYVFKVTDNGIGMTEEQTKRMCDEFYMADKSRSRKEGGAGIGMSIVATILKLYGADLEVDSEIGKGTTMTVSFNPAEGGVADNEG